MLQITSKILKKREKGVALLITLIILLVVSVTALSIAAVSWKERTASVGETKSSIAFQNAQSGAEIILNRIKLISSGEENSFSDCQSDGTISPADGKYKAILLDEDGDTIKCGDINGSSDMANVAKFRSVGMATGVQRAIEVPVAQFSN